MKIITDIKHLNKYCKAVNYKTSKQIANKMILFMLSHKNINDNSLGLACNQLGLDGRIIIIKMKNKWVQLINPIIDSKSKEKIITEESCLSVPNKSIKVERYKSIIITHDTNINNWEYFHPNPMDSIVIQHEIDHLNGIIITDKEL